MSLSEENLKKVGAVKVGLAGLGGLGSNCAFNLVRVGFKKLTLVDFDRVEPSNLGRQFYFLDQVGRDKTEALAENLRRINPDIDIKAFKVKAGKDNVKDLFKDCDIVAECFDKAESKSMLVSELLGTGKFIVSASGLGGFGSSDDIKIHRMKKNLVVIGDLQSDISLRPPLSPRVNIAAAKQADVILEYALNTPA